MAPTGRGMPAGIRMPPIPPPMGMRMFFNKSF